MKEKMLVEREGLNEQRGSIKIEKNRFFCNGQPLGGCFRKERGIREDRIECRS